MAQTSRQREYWLPYQEKFDLFYNSQQIQVAVACVIGANFLTNIIEKEVDPTGDKHTDLFEGFEFGYNILFTLELGINMYAHWFWLFWMSGWNVFDVIVVSIGLVTIMQIELPPGFSMLRMMRAFRVFRLFKRVRSLNKIIRAIFHAIPGMMNAFLILGIIMSIFSILAVELYRTIGDDCHDSSSSDAWMETSRNRCMGMEYFGSFLKSLYTFFQVMTGESWSEAVGRYSIWFYEDQSFYALATGLYFVFYFLISSFILLNVVAAALLDKMVDPDASEDGAANEPVKPEEAEAEPTGIQSPEELQSFIASLEREVEELIATSDEMNTEMSGFTRQLASLRQEASGILTSGVLNCADGETTLV